MRKNDAAAVRAIGRGGRAAVKFGDQPHDVQAQSEMRLVVAALALFEQRFEQVAHECCGDERAVIADLQ